MLFLKPCRSELLKDDPYFFYNETIGKVKEQ